MVTHSCSYYKPRKFKFKSPAEKEAVAYLFEENFDFVKDLFNVLNELLPDDESSFISPRNCVRVR